MKPQSRVIGWKVDESVVGSHNLVPIIDTGEILMLDASQPPEEDLVDADMEQHMVDMSAALAEINEQLEPVLEAAEGLKAKMFARNWSLESSEVVGREYILKMMGILFQVKSEALEER